MPSSKAEKQRARYAADPAYREVIKARCRAAYHAHTPEQREKHRASGRKSSRKKMGIDEPTDEQRTGTCPICLRPDTKLLCDHDHITRKVRGWLCQLCNTWLGPSDDGRVQRAAEYLKNVL